MTGKLQNQVKSRFDSDFKDSSCLHFIQLHCQAGNTPALIVYLLVGRCLCTSSARFTPIRSSNFVTVLKNYFVLLVAVTVILFAITVCYIARSMLNSKLNGKPVHRSTTIGKPSSR